MEAIQNILDWLANLPEEYPEFTRVVTETLGMLIGAFGIMFVSFNLLTGPRYRHEYEEDEEDEDYYR